MITQKHARDVQVGDVLLYERAPVYTDTGMQLRPCRNQVTSVSEGFTDRMIIRYRTNMGDEYPDALRSFAPDYLFDVEVSDMLDKIHQTIKNAISQGDEEQQKKDIQENCGVALNPDKGQVALHLLQQLFSVPEVADIRKCRHCGVPVLHMEHLNLEEAKGYEVIVRTLLGQDTKEEKKDGTV